jgi:hypothetical protein
MMNVMTLLVLICTFLSLGAISLGLVFRQRCKAMTHLLRLERTQSKFAEARNQLVQLVVSGELPIESATFRHLYYLNTMIMRRPDEYPAIGVALSRMRMKGEQAANGNEIAAEIPRWTPAVKKAVIATGDALGSIMFEYSPFGRFALWLARWINPKFKPIHALGRIAQRAEEKQESEVSVKKAQAEIRRMCAV